MKTIFIDICDTSNSLSYALHTHNQIRIPFDWIQSIRTQIDTKINTMAAGNRTNHGPLSRYVKSRVAHAPGMPRTFSRYRLQRKPLVSDPSMRDARAVMQVGIAYLQWRGKRSRHSRRMRTLNLTYLARGLWYLPSPPGIFRPEPQNVSFIA